MKKTFDADIVNGGESRRKTGDSFAIDFHYCALVKVWKKLGFDDKTCALLCDIAMDGDRGIAEVMELRLEFGRTIEQGCPNCALKNDEPHRRRVSVFVVL